jgi:hypothetical protein
MLRWGLAIAGVALIVILAGGVLYDNVIKPRQTLATIGPVSISREDYWKSRANDLYEQALQYQDFAQFVGPDQQGQYRSLAEQALNQIPQVWGSTDVDRGSLETMIDNQLYLQGAQKLGLTMTPEEIRSFALNRFAPPGSPLVPSPPTPTLTAERAAMATSTAEAFLATPVASPFAATPVAGTPLAATPVAATPIAATPIASPHAGVPGATPVASPVAPIGTPSAAEARATAEAGFTQFEETLFPVAHLSQADYDRLIAAPALARQKVSDALAADIGQSAPQVHAAHILLPTREAAEAARARVVDGGEDFAAVAREVSTDQATAGNGGDLGWFVRQEMVSPFADAAFTLEPGTVSEPVESEFGWHVIRVAESDPDRPLTDEQINRIKQEVVDRWLEEQRAAVTVSSTLPPSPTPIPRGFQAPVSAPPPPTPTPLPATPVG